MPNKGIKYKIYSEPDRKSFYLANLYKNITILEIRSDCFIGASGYKLYKFVNGQRIYFSKINDSRYSFFSRYRLTSRFLRAEIYSYKTLKNNKGVCIAKQGIFLENNITGKFEKVFHIMRGSRPLIICEDLEGIIYFGEYFDNKKRDELHIYASFNEGKQWGIVYTFPRNTVRHIHTIQLDPYTGFIWIATGDEDGECIIALTKDKFKTIEILAKRGQEFRTCKFIFLKDKIIYGTDSPYMENYIKAINRKDFSFKQLQKVQGSVINSCQIGNKCIISTTFEPSKINKEKYSYLWISENGDMWSQIGSFKKDIYNITLFQLGTIRFPYYNTLNTNSLFFSGHGLKGIDGHSVELGI